MTYFPLYMLVVVLSSSNNYAMVYTGMSLVRCSADFRRFLKFCKKKIVSTMLPKKRFPMDCSDDVY